VFVKRNPAAPQGFFSCEAAGLRWLGEVTGGVPCVRVLDVDETSLTLQRLTTGAPTPEAALQFGRRLAITHDAGAAGFGAPPAGWTGPGFFGPLHRPLPMSLTPHDSWGEFYARERLTPMLGEAFPFLDDHARRLIAEVICPLPRRRLRRRRPSGPAARRFVEWQRPVDTRRCRADRPGRSRRSPRDRPGHAGAVRLRRA
jgi:hypothetical protein